MRRIIRALAVLILLSIAAPARAQTAADGVRPDNLPEIERSRPIMAYVLAGGFLVGIMAVGLMNSKRSHQK